MGVVDDLADKKQTPAWKFGAGLVGILHGAVHAVTEPEFPRQPERERANLKAVAVALERVHHCTVVVGREPAGDLVLEAKALPEVGLLHASIYHGVTRLTGVIGCEILIGRVHR